MTDRDPAQSPYPRVEWFVLAEDDRTPVDVGGEAAFYFWLGYRLIRCYVDETRLAGYIATTLFWGQADEGPDKLFETTIEEDEEHLPLLSRKPVLASWRSATWDEAERQHDQVVDWLKEYLDKVEPRKMLR